MSIGKRALFWLGLTGLEIFFKIFSLHHNTTASMPRCVASVPAIVYIYQAPKYPKALYSSEINPYYIYITSFQLWYNFYLSVIIVTVIGERWSNHMKFSTLGIRKYSLRIFFIFNIFTCWKVVYTTVAVFTKNLSSNLLHKYISMNLNTNFDQAMEVA